jgi:two-component system CheB/CheR fusion protein
VNSFLECILGSLHSGVVVLDADMEVLVWSHHAEELWGLRSEEVLHRHFLNLDIGLPVAKLHDALRQCLAGKEGLYQTMVLPAINRRGRAVQCRIDISPLRDLDGEMGGVIVLMDAMEAEQPAKGGSPHGTE